MSDRFIQVTNFRFGLDTRRSELLEGSSALVQCQDAHINAGGEVEQRRSFVKTATSFPVDVFGLEVTQSGLVTFGSFVSPGSLPAGVSYRRCDHPTGFDSGGTAFMDNIIASCNYAGLAFVLAHFTDGNVYAYYGDSTPMPLVSEIGRNGVVLYKSVGVAEGSSENATNLTAAFNAINGLTALANQDINGNVVTGEVIITTAPGVHIGLVPTKQSTSGTLVASLVDQNVNGVAGQPAVAAFFVNVNAGSIASITSGAVNLITGIITAQATQLATAQQIAASINANTGSTGYSSNINQTNGRVHVFSPVGIAGNGVTLTITSTTMSFTTTIIDLNVTISPNPPSISASRQTSVVVTATLVNFVGSAPTFNWQILTPEQQVGFGVTLELSIATNGGSVATFTYILSGGKISRYFPFSCQVTVTDSGTGGSGKSVTAPFTVTVGP